MQIYANVPSGNMHSNMANILWIVYMWKLRFCTGNYSERTAGSLKPQTFMQHEPVQKWGPEKITVQWWTQQVQIFVWTVGRRNISASWKTKQGVWTPQGSCGHSTHNGFHHQGTVKATRLPRFAHHLVPGPRWPWLISISHKCLV